MPYDLHQEKNYPQAQNKIYEAALKAVEKLGGKIVSASPQDLRLEVKFDKTILGKVLGERTYLTCVVQTAGTESTVVIDAYPLDAVGQKLMFGARKGVTQTVIHLVIEHLENHLK